MQHTHSMLAAHRPHLASLAPSQRLSSDAWNESTMTVTPAAQIQMSAKSQHVMWPTWHLSKPSGPGGSSSPSSSCQGASH
jgi:hypothetical protein